MFFQGNTCTCRGKFVLLHPICLRGDAERHAFQPFNGRKSGKVNLRAEQMATEWYYDGSGRGSEPLGFHQVGLKYYYEDGSQWRESSFASGYRDLYGIVPLSVKPGKSQNEPEDPEPVRPSGVTGYMDNAVIFTGTPDNPLKTGTWNYDAASDCWYYTAGQILKNTWAYIMNPYAASGQHPSDWFWFDASGRMLAGWQFINGKWYYLNPQRDGTYGACFIGPGKTPDGWEIDAAGAWIGK